MNDDQKTIRAFGIAGLAGLSLWGLMLVAAIGLVRWMSHMASQW